MKSKKCAGTIKESAISPLLKYNDANTEALMIVQTPFWKISLQNLGLFNFLLTNYDLYQKV